MSRPAFTWPETANKLTTYAELTEALKLFVSGHFPLVVVLGKPGLSKSQSLKEATLGNEGMIVKGRKTPLAFYIDLYNHKDRPVILDDADNLLSQKLCREYVKALTETDDYKRLDYDSRGKILEKELVPKYFFTKSPVCIIVNSWNEADHVCQAIASRAEFFVFQPNWSQVYRNAAKWFWDQEIFDYLHARLSNLKYPDCRILVKAANRKKANTKDLPWRDVIDEHCDDKEGLLIRQLIADKSLGTNTKRCERFMEKTGASRATFYRRLAEIKSFFPLRPIKRLELKRDTKPESERPADGPIPGETFAMEGEEEGEEAPAIPPGLRIAK